MDLYEELTTTARGQAPCPAKVPPCMQSFLAMHTSSKQVSGLEWAKLDEVYKYLRNNRNLVIPNHWREYLPKEPSTEAYTHWD